MRTKEDIEEALEYYQELYGVHVDKAATVGADLVGKIISEEASTDDLEEIDALSLEAINLSIEISKVGAVIKVLEWVLDRKYAYERRN